MKKYGHILETSQLAHDLKGKSVRAGFYALAATVMTQVLQLGSTIALARILLPEHFGLVSMVTVLTIVVERFKHLGLSTATIQQKDITHEQVSTLCWINGGAGMLIAMAIAGLSQWIASFYQEPRLVAVTLALSLTFVFGGLSVQHEALLRRQMRFKALANIQIGTTVLSIFLAIELALNGFTYWALVWKEVARTVCEVTGVWIACRWWPSFVISRSEVGPLLRIGKNILSVDIIYSTSRSVDQFLLGKFAGAEPLGLYRQAFQLMAAPMTQLSYPVGSVALPSLSALQDQPGKYRAYYKKILSLLSFVTIPLTTYIAIFSEDIIAVVLGEKWLEAAPLLSVLAIGALVEPLLSTCGIVMVTQRNTKRFFLWTIMYGGCLVLGFILGTPWGAIGVAVGYTVAHYLLMIPCLWFSFKGTPLSVQLFFQAISLPAFFSLIMGMALIFLFHSTSALDSPSRIGLSLSVAAILYLGLWLSYPSGRGQLISDASSLLSVFKPAPNACS